MPGYLTQVWSMQGYAYNMGLALLPARKRVYLAMRAHWGNHIDCPNAGISWMRAEYDSLLQKSELQNPNLLLFFDSFHLLLFLFGGST